MKFSLVSSTNHWDHSKRCQAYWKNSDTLLLFLKRSFISAKPSLKNRSFLKTSFNESKSSLQHSRTPSLAPGHNDDIPNLLENRGERTLIRTIWDTSTWYSSYIELKKLLWTLTKTYGTLLTKMIHHRCHQLNRHHYWHHYWFNCNRSFSCHG